MRDVRAFFGLASYYRRFVKNFATPAEPLSKLTGKGTTFRWTQEAQTAFEKLKQALINTVTLVYPQPGQLFIVDTDASDVACGAYDLYCVGWGVKLYSLTPALLAWSKCRLTN